jgi:hypothetical protein
MRRNFKIIASVILVLAAVPGGTRRARAQVEKAAYSTMAPLHDYLILDKDSEIALARSAAPESISQEAEVMVLGQEGFATAVKGKNGFLCLVERSWGAATDDPEFWNPKVRSPICFDPAAARTYVPTFLMKTKLVLAGKSKAEIARTISLALDKKELLALKPGAMCYMMSKQRYLNNQGQSWHPHLMFFVPGDAAKIWGANLPGSPVLAANDPEEHLTILMVVVGNWSDGTVAPPMAH